MKPELREPSAGTGDEHSHNGAARGDESAAEALHRGFDDVRRIARATVRLGRVRWYRFQASVHRTLRVALLGAWAVVLGIALTVVAAAYVVNGLAAAITELTGAKWSGDLGGGALVLLVIAAIWMFGAAASERARYRRTRARLRGVQTKEPR